MVRGLVTWYRTETRRAMAVAVALGLPPLAADAAIGHFAGKSNDHWAQWVPIWVVPPLTLLLLAASLPLTALLWFRRAVRAAGVVSFAVGGAGTCFHLKALLREVGHDAWTWPTWVGALSVAPPLLAPGAFTGLGLLLWFLGHPRLEMRVRSGDQAA